MSTRQASGPRESERVRALCRAVGFGAAAEAAAALYDDIVAPVVAAPEAVARTWRSDISDDHTPVEFSVALTDDESEVRALFEPQGAEPTTAAQRLAGLAFHDRLERDFDADLSRFRAVGDLFLPVQPQGPFALWSSVVFSRGRPPSFKAYFNPQARGPEHAGELVRAALERLGLAAAWAELEGTVLRRGAAFDELKYFALDLAAGAHARIKVYTRHHEATPGELEAAVAAADAAVSGEASEFARAMRGGSEPMSARAPATCVAFVEGRPRPAAAKLYVPVCAYAHDDAAVAGRVRRYLESRGLSAPTYDATLSAFAQRPLERGVGLQSWVAFRRHQGRARVTVYLATEARRIHPPGSVPAPTQTLAARGAGE